MVQLLSRKRFVDTLGVAGLSFGLLASITGAPLAMAQQSQSPEIERHLFHDEDDILALSDEELRQLVIQLLREQERARGGTLVLDGDADAREIVIALEGGKRLGDGALQVEAYEEFMAALADELQIDDPDELDAAIRAAMMSVVDANAGLTRSEAERQKALIAAADVPIGPAYRGHGG